MKPIRWLCQALCRRYAGLLLALCLAGTALGQPLESRLQQHLEHLAGLGSRVTGYPGAAAAVAYLEARLRAQGVGLVYRVPFGVPVPVDEGAGLELAGGEQLPLHCLWPNLARTSTLPAEGLTGPLVYAGRAAPGELDHLSLAGSVAVLEYDSGSNWVEVFDLGAVAVIFLTPPAPDRAHRREGEDKFLSTPADLPRFYAPEASSRRLREYLAGGPRQGTLRGHMRWQLAAAQNLAALLPGSDPDLAGQVVVVGTYYDAISPVPALAPGAEQACGVAAWLEVAGALAQHPPRRTVLLLATAGHFEALAGMRAWMARMHQLEQGAAPEDELETRLRDLKLTYYLGLDLSSHSRQLALVQAGEPYRVRTIQPPLYGPLLRLAQDWEEREAGGQLVLGGDLKPLNQRRLVGQLPERVPVEGAAFNLAGPLGLTLVSAGDERAAFDSPLDLPAGVEVGNLAYQTRFLLHLIPGLLDEPEAGPQIAEPKDFAGTLSGQVLTWKDYAPDQPVAGAWVRVRNLGKTAMGVRLEYCALTDTAGRFSLPGLESQTLYLKPVQLEAYGADPQSGALNLALDQGPYGAQQYPAEILMGHAEEKLTLVAFPCVAFTLLDLFDPRHLSALEQLRLLDAAQDAPLVNYGLCLPPTPAEIRQRGYGNTLGSRIEKTGVAFVPPGTRVKLTMSTGRYGLGRRLVLLNGSGANPGGAGFDPRTRPRLLLGARTVAADLTRLNAARLEELERHGLRSQLLRRLHTQADSLLAQADTALQAGEHQAFAALSQRSWGLALRTYGGLQDLVGDAVQGIVFFLLLLLPFAYFAERLLLANPRLPGQGAGAALIFLAGFALLRYAHPAFQLNIHPLLILVGFMVLALSGVVIVLGLSRLNTQLRAALSPRLARHRDPGRAGGVLLRALLLGAAQLRHRPWRTGLTCATLGLLSFSLVSLTSINAALRIDRRDLGPSPARAAGALLRQPGWEALEWQAYASLNRQFGPASTLPRCWYQQPALLWGGDGRSTRVEAALGLDAAEVQLTALESTLEAGRFFVPGEEAVCLLAAPQAQTLGVQPGDWVGYLGRQYQVVGLFSPAVFDQLRDLNGAPLTPLDREAQQPEEERAGRARLGGEPAFAHLSAAQVLILPWRAVARWGEYSQLASVALRLDGQKAAAQTGELAEVWGMNFFAACEGRRYLINAVEAQTFSGQAGLWVPLLIGVLIVLNTLLGSVYERLPEIGTLNAIGLAPSHVAGLFWAEAAVYATLSSVLGYLAGQLLSRLGLVYGLFPGLTVNYTSLAAAGTLAGLVLVVLASALYPAHQAARLCVPGVERRWRLPPARGALLELALPFSLRRAEAGALCAFLGEYLEAHDEQSIGSGFYAEAVQYRPDGLQARLWLAPFDQGLSQDFALDLRPETDPRYCALVLRLHRLAGEDHAWRRGNRLLIDQLRRQFLVWRALAPVQREQYR
ncbi:MAG: FtsX-like permease family protein [Candidatus Latescibacteria bacterium]|nr:FtsX-like permease family protein [Candidatus Latescibacterota bacterium]